MAEGLRRAGLAPTMAFDADPDACDSYEANLGHRPVQVDARDLLRLVRAGWSPGPVDLFVADPPCTPWSRAGKRLGVEDERDMLGVTVELITLLHPRAWLIANVPGLDDGPNWPTVQRTIGSLAPVYCIDFARLDAADYGVPQHRVRPFWYGHGIAHRCLEWPLRTHAAPDACGATLPGITERRKPYVTCREALGHLSPEDLGSPVRLRWRAGEKAGNKARASHLDEPAGVVCSKADRGDGTIVFDGPNHRPSRADGPARTLTRNTHGDGSLLVSADMFSPSKEDEPSRTIRSAARGGQLLITPHHPPSNAHEVSRTIRASSAGTPDKQIHGWPWDRPSTTVTSTDRLGPPEHHEGSFLSGPNAIKISEKAAAILQGFPDGWTFCGRTKASRWSQLGQAMPPPLAEAVARSIARSLGRTTRAA